MCVDVQAHVGTIFEGCELTLCANLWQQSTLVVLYSGSWHRSVPHRQLMQCTRRPITKLSDNGVAAERRTS